MFFKGKRENNSDYFINLIRACLNKDKNAQRELIKAVFGFSKSICMKYTSNNEECEEILNDSFLKMFNSLDKYDSAKSFKGWLSTIIINTAIDYYRKRQKLNFTTQVEQLEIEDFSDDIISKISVDEILRIVQTLPESYRIVFLLNVVEGYTHKEIAEKLNIGEGTSKSNLRDARRKLKLLIKQNYPHLYLAYAIKTSKINEN